jgi:hypothetical protein
MSAPTSNKVVKNKPPAAGMGRPKGAINKTTANMKEAITAVYADLQKSTGKDHGHFLEWATSNPTDFYKIAAKLIPLDVNHGGNVGVTLKSQRDAAAAAFERSAIEARPH